MLNGSSVDLALLDDHSWYNNLTKDDILGCQKKRTDDEANNNLEHSLTITNSSRPRIDKSVPRDDQLKR